MSHLLYLLKQRLYRRLLDSLSKHHCRRCRKPEFYVYYSHDELNDLPVNDQGGLSVTYRFKKEFPDTETPSDWTALPEDY